MKGCLRSLYTFSLSTGLIFRQQLRKCLHCAERNLGISGGLSVFSILYKADKEVLYSDQGGSPLQLIR
jgi:hypothetical protein